jgi:hypothetical protein
LFKAGAKIIRILIFQYFSCKKQQLFFR